MNRLFRKKRGEILSRRKSNSKVNQRMSINNLVKDNYRYKNYKSQLIKTTNFDKLIRTLENDLDTYIIEKKTGNAGIADLSSMDSVKVYLGTTDVDNKVITIEEFNNDYKILDDYKFNTEIYNLAVNKINE